MRDRITEIIKGESVSKFFQDEFVVRNYLLSDNYKEQLLNIILRELQSNESENETYQIDRHLEGVINADIGYENNDNLRSVIEVITSGTDEQQKSLDVGPEGLVSKIIHRIDRLQPAINEIADDDGVDIYIVAVLFDIVSITEGFDQNNFKYCLDEIRTTIGESEIRKERLRLIKRYFDYLWKLQQHKQPIPRIKRITPCRKVTNCIVSGIEVSYYVYLVGPITQGVDIQELERRCYSEGIDKKN